ncbi:DUF695 domain-containing protein [Ralstonia pseudosolanacearum]
MADAWELFPAQMGEHRAFISFNSSFGEVAEQDPRTSLLRVRVEFKHPSVEGMPGEDEFQELRKVEDLLATAVEAGGGVQVSVSSWAEVADLSATWKRQAAGKARSLGPPALAGFPQRDGGGAGTRDFRVDSPSPEPTSLTPAAHSTDSNHICGPSKSARRRRQHTPPRPQKRS